MKYQRIHHLIFSKTEWDKNFLLTCKYGEISKRGSKKNFNAVTEGVFWAKERIWVFLPQKKWQMYKMMDKLNMLILLLHNIHISLNIIQYAINMHN